LAQRIGRRESCLGQVALARARKRIYPEATLRRSGLFFLDLPNHGYKSYGYARLAFYSAIRKFCDNDQFLFGIANGDDELCADAQLLNESFGNMIGSRRDHDTVKGTVVRPSVIPITEPEMDIAVFHLLETASNFNGEILVDFDGVDVRCDLC
jgi:hypothetical protein